MPVSSISTNIRVVLRLCVLRLCRDWARTKRLTRPTSASSRPPSHRPVWDACMVTAISSLPNAIRRPLTTIASLTRPCRSRVWSLRWMSFSCICCPNIRQMTRPAVEIQHVLWVCAFWISSTRPLPPRRRVHRQSWLPSTIPTRKKQR